MNKRSELEVHPTLHVNFFSISQKHMYCLFSARTDMARQHLQQHLKNQALLFQMLCGHEVI